MGMKQRFIGCESPIYAEQTLGRALTAEGICVPNISPASRRAASVGGPVLNKNGSVTITVPARYVAKLTKQLAKWKIPASAVPGMLKDSVGIGNDDDLSDAYEFYTFPSLAAAKRSARHAFDTGEAAPGCPYSLWVDDGDPRGVSHFYFRDGECVGRSDELTGQVRAMLTKAA
jgi:hypothetical protein